MGSEGDQEEVVTAAEVSAGCPPAAETPGAARRRRRAPWRQQPPGTHASRGYPASRWPGTSAEVTTPAASPGSGYAIRVEGLLDAHWSQWLEGMTITHEGGGVTCLEGPLIDQAALHGLLNKLRDLRLPIVTVQRLGALGSDAPYSKNHRKAMLDGGRPSG